MPHQGARGRCRRLLESNRDAESHHKKIDNGEGSMEVLLIAFGSLAVIWVIVILGSPMFGSK